MEGGKTDKPFTEAFIELKDEKDLSYPQLERLTEERAHRKLSSTMINNLALGKEKLTKDQLEIIAAALKIDPRYFKEYREFLAEEKIEERPRLADALLDEDITQVFSAVAGASEDEKREVLEDFKKILKEHGLLENDQI